VVLLPDIGALLKLVIESGRAPSKLEKSGAREAELLPLRNSE
jgi:hypothetical protein